MTIFIILILIIILLQVFLSIFSKKPIFKKIYCIIVGLFLFLFSALRHYSVGTDSMDYKNAFIMVMNRTFGQVIVNLQKDLFYEIFVKIISLFTNNYQVYFSLIATIFAISVSVFIYKYSNEPTMSFLMLLSFSFYQFSLTGLRQTVAFSILFFAYPYLKNKKLIKFILIVCFASLFHLSALIFLIAYPLVYLKVNYKTLFFIIISSITIYVFRVQIILWLVAFPFVSKRGYQLLTAGGGETTFFIYLLVFVYGLIFKDSFEKKYPDDIFLYNLLAVGIMFQILVPIQNNIFRIVWYFSIYFIIFIPKVLASIENKKLVSLGYYIVFCLLLVQYFVFTKGAADVLPYKFYWQ